MGSVHHGDCLDVMAGMEPESVDAIVTDPPYGLEFMGVAWDTMRPDGTPRPRNEWGDFGSREHARGPHDLARVQRKKAVALEDFSRRWAEAAYRVAKPSAYLLAFGGTRTVHRMTVALEDAGWIIRDMLVWAYASGFPKSKASLKPAWEPIVMARKPGPLRMLAIDECRIPGTWSTWRKRDGSINHEQETATSYAWDGERTESPAGRWPANVILTDPIFDGGVEGVVGGGESRPGSGVASARSGGWWGWHSAWHEYVETHDEAPPAGWEQAPLDGDSGTYSRFFLLPKADRSDREPVLGIGGEAESGGRVNVHPTQAVKPTDLMRHLVRLVTPAGGTVLDPFLGSGTTALAAEMEGFAWIGIEREAEYVAIAEARLNGVQKGLGLSA